MVELFVIVMMIGVFIIAFAWNSPVRKYWFGTGVLVIAGSMFGLIGGSKSKDLPNGSVGAVVFGVLLLLCAVPCIVTAVRKSSENSQSLTVSARLLTFDEKSSTLTLKGRDKALQSCISMQPHKVLSVSHKPEEYIYTSATVGRITTGGFSKVGGYDYVSDIKKTDRYALTYGGKSIFTIRLSPELASLAENSSIKEYIKRGNEIVVVDPDKYDKMALTGQDMLMLMRTNYSQFLSISARIMAPGYPEYDKCKRIYDWICDV